MCEKCDKALGLECICNIDEYLKIGDISACGFLDNHASYKPESGSIFFQGWMYKHQQMKHKLSLKSKEIEKLKAENEKLKKCVEFYTHEKIRNEYDVCKEPMTMLKHEYNGACAACNEESKGNKARQTLKELEH